MSGLSAGTYAVEVTIVVDVRIGMDKKEEQNGVAELYVFRSLTTFRRAMQKKEETGFRSWISCAGVAATEAASGPNNTML